MEATKPQLHLLPKHLLPKHLLPKHQAEASSAPIAHPPHPVPTRLNQPSLARQAHRQLGLMTGVAIVLTSGAVTQVMNQTPEYEGDFELAIAAAAPGTAPEFASPDPQVQADIAPPSSLTAFSDTQQRILKSPRLIDPIVQSLRVSHPNLDYNTLTKNLRITVDADQTLKVAYRSADPKQVEQVLQHLAQSYIHYSQECQDGTCKGIQFVEAQIPQIQTRINTIRQQIREFREAQGWNNLEAQIKLFNARAAEIAKQEAEIQGKLAEAKSQYDELQQQMALKPDEAIAINLLNQDPQYQTLRQQFQEINQQMAQEFGRLDSDTANLKTLYNEYQSLLNQLNQVASLVLQRYVTNPEANLQDPVLHEPAYLERLQQSIATVHYIQVLQTREQSLAQSKQLLAQQRYQLAELLRQDDEQRLKLQAEIGVLQSYLARREMLKAEATTPTQPWRLVAPPELIHNQAGQPLPMIPYLQRNLAIGTVLGALAGIGVTAAAARRRHLLNAETAIDPAMEPAARLPEFSYPINLPVDVVFSKAKPLVEASPRDRLARVA